MHTYMYEKMCIGVQIFSMLSIGSLLKWAVVTLMYDSNQEITLKATNDKFEKSLKNPIWFQHMGTSDLCFICLSPKMKSQAFVGTKVWCNYHGKKNQRKNTLLDDPWMGWYCVTGMYPTSTFLKATGSRFLAKDPKTTVKYPAAEH